MGRIAKGLGPMHTGNKLLQSVAAVTIGLFIATAQAEDKEEKKEVQKSSAESQAAMNLAAAMRVANVGRESKAPEALLDAARVIGKTNVLKLEPKEAKADGLEAYDPLKEASKLIDEALRISGGDEGVKKVAEALQTQKENELLRPDIGKRWPF